MYVFIHLSMVSVLNDQVMCTHLPSRGLMFLIDHLYASVYPLKRIGT
jgi:hypothetical protein